MNSVDGKIPKRKEKNKTLSDQTNKMNYHGLEPPTKTAVFRVIHLCPAAPKPAVTRAFKVASMLASGMMIA